MVEVGAIPQLVSTPLDSMRRGSVGVREEGSDEVVGASEFRGARQGLDTCAFIAWIRHVDATPPISTQVYKLPTSDIGVPLRRTSIPFWK